MKRRCIVAIITMLIAVFLWNGCKTVTDLTKGSEERNLIRLKRGTYNAAGLYANIYYEFEVKMPEGWVGDVDDPPNVLVVNPSSKDIAQASARKFIDITVSVLRRPAEESLDSFVNRYAENKSYERILERPSMVTGGESKKILFYGRSDAKEMKIISLFVYREDSVIIVECRALKPLFDNVEAQFGACLDSFRITGKEKPNEYGDGRLSTLDQDEDYIVYIVTTKDTAEELAKDFLGSEDRAWMIMSANEIERLKAGERIRIPRFISYEVKPGDSLPLIAQRVLGDAKYADLIRGYNNDAPIAEGSTIYIPLYDVELPVVGETYRDIAQRHYSDPDLADRLLQFNNLQPLESLERVKLPIFFRERF
ncbi:MAG TPA: LysM peptidoglycan-binding domain-containing protein [bacterium]|nr:LysM peptidoglycan-binding domain-containing protein [bacterium]